MLITANIIVGALIGAAGTYAYKDDSARSLIKKTGAKITGMFSSKEKVEEINETAEEVVTAESVSDDNLTQAETQQEQVVEKEVDKT